MRGWKLALFLVLFAAWVGLCIWCSTTAADALAVKYGEKGLGLFCAGVCLGYGVSCLGERRR